MRVGPNNCPARQNRGGRGLIEIESDCLNVREATQLASDRARLDDLFRRYGTTVRRLIARILVNAADSDDVVQDTFLGVWRKARAGGLESDARAYVLQSALNSARDKNRHRRLIAGRTADSLSVDLPDASTAPADDVYFWRERIEMLGAALDELDLPSRSAFVLYHLEGMSIPAIAKHMGKSTRMVERYLARALAYCTERASAFHSGEEARGP